MIQREEDLINTEQHSAESGHSKPVLLYFYHHYAGFVRKDHAIMQKAWNVKVFELKVDIKFLMIWGLIKQFFFILINHRKAEMMVVQFAGYISFLPSLLGRLLKTPVLIISGGTDCVSYPSIKYGNFYNSLIAWFTRRSYHLASHIAPVSESLAYCEDQYNSSDYPFQGFQYFCKNLKTPFTVIENGYSGDFWKPVANKRIPSSFITLTSGFGTRFYYELKGIDLFIEAARNMPNSTFTIVGVPVGYRYDNQPKNLVTHPFCSAVELREIYSRHEFFLQISMSEGFPNAITEAMLCGCIPVGSNVAAIPRIIGDTGFILKKRDSSMLIDILRKADAADKLFLAEAARERIKEEFTLVRRQQELLELLNALRNH